MTKPRKTSARELNGLCGAGRGARRKCDERAGSVGTRRIDKQCFENSTTAEIYVAADDCTADLRISGTLVTVFVMRQRLIGALRCFRQDVRDSMRQAAHLSEQQGEDQQKSGKRGTMHSGFLFRKFNTGDILLAFQLVGRSESPGAGDGQDVGILGDVRGQRRIGRGEFDDAHRRCIQDALS
jgi:hypothetical protein